MEQIQGTRVSPTPNVLVGITHTADMVPLVREPRTLKVGIGVPKGKAVTVYTHQGKWNIRFGVWEKVAGGKDRLVMKTVFQSGARVEPPYKLDALHLRNGVAAPGREAAEAFYQANRELAAVSNRPQKIPFFTFTSRRVIEQDGKPVEVFEPDFRAIEAHGDTPKEVPIIITSDNPFTQEYAWWTASELKCHGDGLAAKRNINTPPDGRQDAPDPYQVAAKLAGQKYYLYEPCYTTGCPHAGVDCKSHVSVNFQLQKAMRIGSTAYFASTGEVSAGKLNSSFQSIRGPIERRGYSVAGIPLRMVLSSFRANPEGGKAAAQPYVYLEVMAETAEAFRKVCQDESWVPAQIGPATTRMIEAPATIESGEEDAEMLAPAMAAEFYPEYEDDEDAPAASTAQTATKVVQESMTVRLAREAEARLAQMAPEPVAGPDPKPGPNFTELKELRRTRGVEVFNAQLQGIGLDPGADFEAMSAGELRAILSRLHLLPEPASNIGPYAEGTGKRGGRG